MPITIPPPAPPALVRAFADVSHETQTPIAFTQYTLPNGLRVILAPDPFAPVIATNVTYDVGSRNERPGRTGFAHLFEHMMFQGSEKVGKGEHILLTTSVGGTMNGTTNQDRTNFFEALPKNQLKLALFLEADRMRSLDISQANLDNQRAVVQEEKRQSYENRPYGQIQENLLSLAYSNFAYKHTTIGSMADLDAATIKDVRDFFATYYAPNNAVLTVCGDFDPEQARALVSQYFGGIPQKPSPPAVDAAEPDRFALKDARKTLQDRLARQTRLEIAYVTVPGDDPDYYPLRVLGNILSGGRTTRLYKQLVETNQTLNISAREGEGRGDSLFSVSGTIAHGGSAAMVEATITAEIERVAESGVTSDELAQAITRERVGLAGAYQNTLSRATALSWYAVAFHDPNRINTLPERLAKVTAADVQRAARKYLTNNNRAVIVVEPDAQTVGN